MADKKYVMRPTLLAWGKGQNTTSSGGKCQQFIVRSIGEGVTAEIRVSNDTMTLECLLSSFP